MKQYFYLLITVFFVSITGCSDDTVINATPLITAQNFTVPESIKDNVVIGTVQATDADKDSLTFSISANDNGLFEISNDGKLSLANGKKLDYETKRSHTITVEVTDGNSKASNSIIINVRKLLLEGKS